MKIHINTTLDAAIVAGIDPTDVTTIEVDLSRLIQRQRVALGKYVKREPDGLWYGSKEQNWVVIPPSLAGLMADIERRENERNDAHSVVETDLELTRLEEMSDDMLAVADLTLPSWALNSARAMALSARRDAAITALKQADRNAMISWLRDNGLLLVADIAADGYDVGERVKSAVRALFTAKMVALPGKLAVLEAKGECDNWKDRAAPTDAAFLAMKAIAKLDGVWRVEIKLGRWSDAVRANAQALQAELLFVQLKCPWSGKPDFLRLQVVGEGFGLAS